MKKIVIIALRVILAAILLMNCAVLLLHMPSDYGMFANIPLSTMYVSGGSMEPVLHDGDAIVIHQTPFEQLKEGDIVVFQRGESLIVHEIIERKGDTLITQGSANAVPDEPVSQEEYRAKMLWRVPGLGAIWRISAKPAAFLLFAALLTVLIFGDDIFALIYKKLFERKR